MESLNIPNFLLVCFLLIPQAFASSNDDSHIPLKARGGRTRSIDSPEKALTGWIDCETTQSGGHINFTIHAQNSTSGPLTINDQEIRFPMFMLYDSRNRPIGVSPMQEYAVHDFAPSEEGQRMADIFEKGLNHSYDILSKQVKGHALGTSVTLAPGEMIDIDFSIRRTNADLMSTGVSTQSLRGAKLQPGHYWFTIALDFDLSENEDYKTELSVDRMNVYLK